MLTFLMSQGGKVEKSGGFPSPQVQTETDPSAHSGAERLSLVMTEEKSSRETSNMLIVEPATKNKQKLRKKSLMCKVASSIREKLF